MNLSGPGTVITGNACKIIQDRINLVEHHFGEICEGIGGYTRAVAKLRDKGDKVSRTIVEYARNETYNPTTKAALKEFVESLSAVEDYRDTKVKRLELKVLNPLAEYGKTCKVAKERIKSAFGAHDKEMKQRRALERLIERDPRDSHQITQAQTELQRAAVDASRVQQDLENEMDIFEKKKLEDVKRVLSDFVSIQLAFHAKALEFYSQCHRSLGKVQEAEDLEEFRNSLRPLTSQSSRQELQRQMTVSGGRSLGTIGRQGDVSAHFLVGSGNEKGRLESSNNRLNTLNSTNPSSMYSQGTTALDEDEDSEEEEDDDDDDNNNDDYDDDDDDDTEQPSQRGSGGMYGQKIQTKPQVTPRKR